MPRKPKPRKPYVFAKLFGPEGALTRAIDPATVSWETDSKGLVWVEVDGRTNR